MKAKKLLFLSVVILVTVISYSAYQLNLISENYTQEAQVHERMLQFKPVLQTANSVTISDNPLAVSSIGAVRTVNQSIIDLQGKYPDAIGWLMIPNTGIDYPFAQGPYNDYYLHMDLDKNQLFSGTLFMESRNNSDFGDFNTIIFGHNMKNGSMFGTLKNFDDKEFFDANSKGVIFTANETYEIEFMAWIVIAADDEVIYNSMFASGVDATEFLDYVRSVSRNYREIGADIDDRFVTLSTCNYEFTDARMALVGRSV